MPKAPYWTEADKATAIAMRLAGHTAAEIANVVGRNKNAVAMRLFDWGVKAPAEVVTQRRREQVKALRDSPNYGEKRRQALSAAYTPERRAASGARAREFRIWEMGSHIQTPEQKRAALEKAKMVRRQQLFGWCPPHLLPEYRKLVSGNHGTRFHAAEARRMLTDEWLKQLRRALRQIAEVAKPLAEEQARQRNSFEAQLERVKAGQARVVPTFRPGRALAEQRSLIGGTMADIAA